MTIPILAASFLGVYGAPILIVVALALAIIAIIKPAHPLLAVAVLLLAVAMLGGK